MFKPLTVLVILVVVAAALVNGQEENRGPTGQQGIVPRDSFNPAALAVQGETKSKKNGLIAGLLDGPLSLLSPITKPLGFLLNPIISFVDLLLSPLNFILSPILTPVSWLLRGIGSLVSALLGRTNNSQQQTAAKARARRAIMDSFMGMVLRMTLQFPLRFVRSIIGFLLSPFGFIYEIITWPFNHIFGHDYSDSGGDLDLTNNPNDLSTDPFYTDIPSYMNNLISSFLLNISKSSQDAAYETLGETWSVAKSTLLPAFDKLIVKLMDSGWLPDDIVKTLGQIHTVYAWIHTLGLI